VASKPPEKDTERDGAIPDPSKSPARYRLCNIGNSQPVELEEFIDAIEQELGKKAIRKYMPMQPGDVPKTFADVSHLQQEFEYRPATPVKDGIRKFIEWWQSHYK
jgi:UDP-glucuronate 4-epimerase